MSSEGRGRRAASSSMSSSVRGMEVASIGVDAPAEVVDFIRHCYRRRGIGWPELYDEMCAVAARGAYRGMDYESLANLGIGFSLRELPRLAAIAQAVVAEERRARPMPARRPAVRRGDALPPEEGSAVEATHRPALVVLPGG